MSKWSKVEQEQAITRGEKNKKRRNKEKTQKNQRVGYLGRILPLPCSHVMGYLVAGNINENTVIHNPTTRADKTTPAGAQCSGLPRL